MRTVTLQSLLLRAWQRVGNDAADVANIPSGARTMLVAAANDAISQCWEWADWPELMREELRVVQGDATNGFRLDYEQPGETPMGEIFSVLIDSPATHVAPRQIGYSLLGDAIRFSEDTSLPTSVYVRYRIRPVDYVERVQAVGMTAALLETVPAVLGKAVSYMLAAALLEEDGQLDKSLLMEQKAEAELISERDKYVFQQGQTQRWTARVNQY